jgi:hypothetical protein
MPDFRMPAAYLLCRTLRHRWDQLDGPPLGWEHVRDDGYWLRCERCGMLKLWVIDRYGDIIWTRYIAPEGYYHSREGEDDDAPSLADYRLQWVRSLGR